jgi:hypothetical protein
MRRVLRSALACGAAACCVLAAGTATARASGTDGAAVARPTASSGSSWGTARPVPGLLALEGGQGSAAAALSCPAAGDCAVGGSYAGGNGLFAADERAGTWRNARTLAGVSSTAGLASLSCAAPGNCAADGYSGSGESGGQAIVAGEVNGTWQAAFAVAGTIYDSGPSSEMDAMSCPAVGSCVAGGYTDTFNGPADVTQAIVAEEKHGTWGSALQVPGTGALNTGLGANVSSVSCTSPGNCGAGGYYGVYPDFLEAFVVTETNGTWGTAIEVPGSAALNTGHMAGIASVSCARPEYCAAGGSYTDGALHTQAFVVTESDGTWGTALTVAGALNTGGNAAVNSVACPAPGDCAAVGSYADSAGHQHAFVITEKNGAWQPERELAGALNTGGNATAHSIACPSPGNCAAGGSYADGAGHQQAFVVTERNGAWQPARETATALDTGGSAAVGAVSCPAVSSCTAAGYYSAAGVMHAFVVAGAITQPTTTTLALSAASVSYGHEQSERITVTVVPRYGGTPAGTVKVRAGHVTVCDITLASGTGSCRLSARQLRPGTYRLTAAYAGGPGFLASTSAARSLRVSLRLG